MPDRILRAPDIRENREGEAAPLLEPGDALTGSSGGPGTERSSSSVVADKVPTLASPTLAALYASQGHREMAAAIYAQLGQGGRGLPLDKHPGSLGPAGQEPRAIVEKLSALRRAAHRRREETRGADRPPEPEDVADGR